MTNEQVKKYLIDFYRNITDDDTVFNINLKNSILDVNGNLKTWISEKTLGLALYSVFNAVKKTREDEEKRLRVEKLNALHSTDEYFGEVGYKFKGHPMKVTLTRIASYETQFGTTWVWNMIDEEGHIIVWKSSTNPSYEIYRLLNIAKQNLRDYCESTYKGYNVKECIEEHSDDCKIKELMNELDRCSKLDEIVNKNIPLTFNIVGGSVKEHKEYTNRDGVTIKQTMVTRCKIDNWEIA